MRINGQQLALEVMAGPADLSQGDLQGLGFGDGVRVEQFVNGGVAGHKGQAVGDLEPFLAERAPLTQALMAQGGFVHQLQRQAREDRRAGLAGPAAEQVPHTQAQVLGDQEPGTHLVASDFLGQQLAHAPFQADRIGRFVARFLPGALGGQEQRLVIGAGGVKFFLQTEVLDDAFDAANADRMLGLLEFWAMTSGEAWASRKRCRMTWRVTSGGRREGDWGPRLRL